MRRSLAIVDVLRTKQALKQSKLACFSSFKNNFRL
jgi:hypothetical protein